MTEHGRSGRDVTPEPAIFLLLLPRALCRGRATRSPHKPRWRHQRLKNTHSNKARGNILAANYPQEQYPNAVISRLYFSYKIDSQHVLGIAARVRTVSVPTVEPRSFVYSSSLRLCTTLRAWGIFPV